MVEKLKKTLIFERRSFHDKINNIVVDERVKITIEASAKELNKLTLDLQKYYVRRSFYLQNAEGG